MSESSSESTPTKKTVKKSTRKTTTEPSRSSSKPASTSSTKPSSKPSTSSNKPSSKPTGTSSGEGRGGSGGSDGSETSASPRARTRAPAAESKPRPRSIQVAARAASEFYELTGKPQEGVVGLERTDGGWTVQLEVIEVRRIPDTTDMLGIYEIDTDDQGSLEGYRRVRRYVRGSGEEGS